MVKWAEICPSGDHFEKERFLFLSEYLNQKNLKNEVSFESCSSMELFDKIKECQEKYNHLRIHPDYGIYIVKQSVILPSEVVDIGACDAMVMQDGAWWLRSYLFKAFHHIVSNKGEHIDVESAALIVGTGSRARAMISGVIKLGFKTVNISSIFDEQGLQLVDELKRKFFGVKFEFVPQSRLVTLPGIHGVMINTTPFTQNNDLISELNYYNFLQREGFVIDCNTFPVMSELTREAESIGASVIQGYELLTTADIIWVNDIFSANLKVEDYSQKFFEKFENQQANANISLS